MGELAQDLAAHSIVGIDTAPFIYLWERHPSYFDSSEALFNYLKNPQVEGVTSIITLIETCVYPERQGRQDLVEAYERALLHSQQVRMLAVDTSLARRAIALRAQHNIRVPDALQIAAALHAGATVFVTNDQKLAKVKGIQVLVLGDYVT